ncbi:hypothetical protein BC830DRAFT_1156309 [Chytriomyces sp. MP71]|nr:hypothetical protein BC830DRAFT_1156309 [Chytriomyces sp. MP71]
MLTPPQLPALPPTRGSLEKIVAAIPPPRCVKPSQRPFLVFMGSTPGVGTSSLAKKVAVELNAELINPDTILSATINPSSETAMGQDGQMETVEGIEKGVFETLIAGRELETPLFFHQYLKLVQNDDAQFRGIVLEGLPYACSLFTDASSTPTTPEVEFPDLVLLEKLVQHKPPHFKLILVWMKMRDADLMTRRVGQWVDPVTGNLYPGAQVEYSKRRRAEGWVDGTPDVLYDAELDVELKTWNFEVEDAKKVKVPADEEEENDADDAGDGEEGDEGGGDEGEGGEGAKRSKAKTVNAERFRLANKTVWTIVSKEILDRLVKRPEDVPENLAVEISRYQSKKAAIRRLQEKLFDPFHTITMDASQHPDILLRNAMNRLGTMGFSLLEKPVSTKRLDVPPAFFQGMTQNDIYTYLTSFELESGEPQRDESSWGPYCPVKFYENNRLIHTNFEIPVSYRGCFYFLSDEYSYGRFVANPDKYLETPPTLMGINLCILGGPFTGKTAQSKMLAQIYNLKYVSIDDILSTWDSDLEQRQLKKTNKRYKEIVERCRSGQSVAPETMIELILQALRESTPNLTEPIRKAVKSTGWIIDGFPRTIDEARAMVTAGLLPDYVVLLKNDINDERVRMRLKTHLADSKSGKPWIEKPLSPATTASQFPVSQPITATGKQTSRTSLLSRHQLDSPHFSNQLISQPLKTPSKRAGSTAQTPLRPTPPITKQTPRSKRHSVRSKVSKNEHEKVEEVRPKPILPVDDMPAAPIAMFPYFDNLFNGFKEELAEIIKLLETRCKVVETGAEQSIPTILAIIQSAIDSFMPKAKEMSEKQLSEMPAQFEMGPTKEFCPFALRQVNILQKGNPQYAVKYLSQIYYLSSEDAKYAFLMEPHNFVDVRKLMTPPPPRLFFLGPQGSGKSVCMKALEHWGAPIIRFDDYIVEFCKTAEKSVRDEIEYMMRENAGLLSPILIEDIMTSLFKKEPYVSKGFLLEGFPRTKADAEVVVKHNMHIDAVIVLRIEAELAAKRILSEKKKEVMQRKKDAKVALEQDEFSTKASLTLMEADADLKKLQDHENDLLDEYIDLVDKGNMRVGDAVSTFESSWQVPIIEIDCNKCLRPMIGSLKRQCMPYFENRRSLLSNAMSIDYREAEILLRLGIKTYSAFEKICPVSLKKNSSVLKRYTGTKPVLYREHIYYLRGDDNREEFINNIHEYISLPPPQPAVRPQICILGRPKAGKSAAAERIAAEYDMVHLTIPTIVESILAGNENIALAKKLSACLTAGESLSESLTLEAVLCVTSRAVCMARGWILDGYPQTITQAKALEACGLVPHMVFHLQTSREDMTSRCRMDLALDVKARSPRLNYEGVMSERDAIHEQNAVALRKMYSETYVNWIEINGGKNKWYVKNELVRYLEGATMRRQNYTDLKTRGETTTVAH